MTPIFILATLLYCSGLYAMDDNNNNNNNRYNQPIVLCDDAPPAYGSEEDQNASTTDTMKHREKFQPILEALKKRRAKMKKDRMILSVSFKNKKGSDFLSASMSYDLNDDGTCPPTDGWELVSFENANGISNNPLPLNYEKPLDDQVIQACGQFNLRKMLITQRVHSRVSEEQKEREKTVYTSCFTPSSVSLEKQTVAMLVSLTKVLDGQDSIVIPKTKCIVPLYMKHGEPYTQQFNPADTEPITLEIKTGIYN